MTAQFTSTDRPVNQIFQPSTHTVVTIPTVHSDAARIASEIGEAITRSDDASAFRRLLQLADNLAAERGATIAKLRAAGRPAGIRIVGGAALALGAETMSVCRCRPS